jgi:hypothetical protein
MPRLTDKQIADAVKAAGFPESAWVTAIAVALAESGGNSDALNDANSNGSSDYGLFQVNSVHAGLLNGGNWRDPVYNAKMALSISSNGSNWKPWVAYTTGRHVPFIPRARKAAGTTAGSAPTALPVVSIPGTGDFFSLISDSKTWLRVGYFVVGGILVLIALGAMTNVTSLIPAGKMVKAAKGLKAVK